MATKTEYKQASNRGLRVAIIVVYDAADGADTVRIVEAQDEEALNHKLSAQLPQFVESLGRSCGMTTIPTSDMQGIVEELLDDLGEPWAPPGLYPNGFVQVVTLPVD